MTVVPMEGNMNKLTLAQAMENADAATLDEVAGDIAAAAIATVLRQQPDPEEERQRLRDLAMADAIEAVARARGRNGRRVCSRHDAEVTRKIYELLRSVFGSDGGCDNDPSWQ
jgi:erythromycin esterase-like protein